MMNRIALKEWAAAIRALENGMQTFLLRKGGIAEETRDFQVQSNSFYLFPATLTAYATVIEDREIMDADQLHKLDNFHIWTDRFAEDRLKWKKNSPLHLLLLRVYKLDQPIQVKIEPGYLGCKSWIELQEPLPARQCLPVLDDAEFEARIGAVKRALLPNP